MRNSIPFYWAKLYIFSITKIFAKNVCPRDTVVDDAETRTSNFAIEYLRKNYKYREMVLSKNDYNLVAPSLFNKLTNFFFKIIRIQDPLYSIAPFWARTLTLRDQTYQPCIVQAIVTHKFNNTVVLYTPCIAVVYCSFQYYRRFIQVL